MEAPDRRGAGHGARLHLLGLHELAARGCTRYVGSTDERNPAMVRIFEPDPELLAINIADARADHLRSYDRAVVARSTSHLWSARVPTDLAVGEHRIEVRAQSRYEGELQASTTYHLVDWDN